MSECKYKASDGWCESIYGYNFGCRCVANEDSCLDYKPITNADRIRAMDDKKLCEFLYSYKFCDMCEEGCEECRYYGDCERALLSWLQQPVKESVDHVDC